MSVGYSGRLCSTALSLFPISKLLHKYTILLVLFPISWVMLSDDVGLNVLESGSCSFAYPVLFVTHSVKLLFMAFRDLFGLLQLCGSCWIFIQ